MRWTNEAEKALSRVPFFVRKRVKSRVETEAADCGASEVTIGHARTCQNRFLNRMEDEVKGFQVENCFGPSGCTNRAMISDELPLELEKHLKKKDLKAFLKRKVGCPLKMHHEFRVSISDCPNACSRPQIADIGIIGACRPEVTEEICTQCGECVDICRENAISLGDALPIVDLSRCLACGKCIEVCPSGTLKEGARGYRIFLGGKLGRHPRLGTELTGIFSMEGLLYIFDSCLDHYETQCLKGERFGVVLERTGMDWLEATTKKLERNTK